MSDIEDEGIYEEEIESSDDEEYEVRDLASDDVKDVGSNKFMGILRTNMLNPSKFVVHALILHRVKALFSGAAPLSSNPPPPGNEDYTNILIKLIRIAVDEIMENRSPMTFWNPVIKAHTSANELDKPLLKKMMDDFLELAAD